MYPKKNKCAGFRQRLFGLLFSRLSLDQGWLSEHIANCPRCQKRLASVNRVNLSLMLLKSQTHQLDLLARANSAAVGILKHSLRNAPKAAQLQTALPHKSWTNDHYPLLSTVSRLAACLTIAVLFKAGILSSMAEFKHSGDAAVKQYYSARLDEDICEDLFSV